MVKLLVTMEMSLPDEEVRAWVSQMLGPAATVELYAPDDRGRAQAAVRWAGHEVPVPKSTGRERTHYFGDMCVPPRDISNPG